MHHVGSCCQFYLNIEKFLFLKQIQLTEPIYTLDPVRNFATDLIFLLLLLISGTTLLFWAEALHLSV